MRFFDEIAGHASVHSRHANRAEIEAAEAI